VTATDTAGNVPTQVDGSVLSIALRALAETHVFRRDLAFLPQRCAGRTIADGARRTIGGS
jgi:hypothetical protein